MASWNHDYGVAHGVHLVEQRAWYHLGVRPVYFHYIKIHVIYSDHIFENYCDFCEAMCVNFSKRLSVQLGIKTEKRTTKC